MDAFRVWIRNDRPNQAFDLKFEMNDGTGVFVLRRQGRKDPEPSHHGDEENVPLDVLRAGRFVHHLGSGGQKHQYALSRVPADSETRIKEEWTILTALTEQGFRYLVVPDTDMASPKVAAVAVGPKTISQEPVARPTRQTGGTLHIVAALPRDRAVEALVRELLELQREAAATEASAAALRLREKELMALLQAATERG